jgi:hypothetical protein
MPKATPAGQVTLPHDVFEANAVPDVFDARDLEYRPRLDVLPRSLDQRPKRAYVMTQEGSSCTGHAVAAMVNAILWSQADHTRVSPYMLYALARRYDEFEGDADAGSSLRGALKGWFYHGVLPEAEWPTLTMAAEPDVDLDDRISALALERPLGAFYRVNTTRLDDLQSAITELRGIVVSASIHDGWHAPEIVTRPLGGRAQELHVIKRTDRSRAVGGHAFCLVGYNDIGFLVQNSWGTAWGDKGFATLPYDDWLESGYDAWVARPGVPSVVSQRVRSKILGGAAGGGFVEAPGPNAQVLATHVVNLGNDGRLSRTGRFTSSTSQIQGIFTAMRGAHQAWRSSPRRIVLYAHGGLTSELTGLDIAQRQLGWWMRNHVYPVTFAWQTGVTETVQDELSDLVGRKVPTGVTFNLFEQVDRVVEKTAKRTLRWIWDEMKENAAGASDPLPDDWRTRPDQEIPGASAFVAELSRYLAQDPDVPTEVHLVGHSAGANFLTGVLRCLDAAGIPVESLTYLAGALRTDDWVRDVLPVIENGRVTRFTAFGLSATRELDDVCGAGGVAVYRKSLLYLVSRALERPIDRQATDVPLVGMARFADLEVDGRSFAGAVAALPDAHLVWAPSATPADRRSDATSHGGFDDDSATMTSVLLRILGTSSVAASNEYVPNVPVEVSRLAVDRADTSTTDDSGLVIANVRELDAGGRAAAQRPTETHTETAPASDVRIGPSGNRVVDAVLRAGGSARPPSRDDADDLLDEAG